MTELADHTDDPLSTPVQFLTGVGPARAALLAKLEIFTVRDLLWHLPRDVLDLSEVKKPNELVDRSGGHLPHVLLLQPFG